MKFLWKTPYLNNIFNLFEWKGFWLGFSWIHCNGSFDKTNFTFASYHHPKSITWRWALSWRKSSSVFRPNRSKWVLISHRCNSSGFKIIGAPFLGELSLHTQDHMFEKEKS